MECGSFVKSELHSNFGSSLAAMYHQCRFCANTTIIVFQDENGVVQIGNFTSVGWTLSQLTSAFDPTNCTALALAPHYVKGFSDEILLFYQQSNLNLGMNWWRPASLRPLCSSALNSTLAFFLLTFKNSSGLDSWSTRTFTHFISLTNCRSFVIFQSCCRRRPRSLGSSFVCYDQRCSGQDSERIDRRLDTARRKPFSHGKYNDEPEKSESFWKRGSDRDWQRIWCSETVRPFG